MPESSRSLKELFLAALAIAPAERAAWLDRECAPDAELRRRVDLLLAAHDAPQSLLDPLAPPAERPEPETGAVLAAAAEGPASVNRDELGALIAGRYKLLEQIGEGGMGTVWMAQQTEPVKRLVALKLIKLGMDSKQVLARFEAERQALALMDHPNIAKVFDGGLTNEPDAPARDGRDPLARASGSGRPYFVMELVKGVPITKYCDEHRLTPRRRLELFVPVCQAIQHAHQKGVIHRDIKPNNVLVTLYDDRPVPKVIDFGVAKATGQQLTEQTLHTGFGAVVGTVEYMSPEQASFNQLDVDTRSDIYSLGVLLYELLAGSPPFTRKDLEKAGMMEMLRVIREQEPSKPSTKLSTADGLPTLAANRGTEPAKLTRLVRGELDWIVMKALEKDRSRRYETANGFAMDLQRYLADEPVVAGPPSARYRLRKFVRRNKGPVLAASVMFLLLIGGIIGTSWGLLRAERARQAEAKQRQIAEANEKRANAERDRAETEKQIAQAVRRFLQRDLLLQADPWKQANRLLELGKGSETGENPTVKDLLDRAAAELVPEKIEEKFPRQPLVQAEILRTVGDTYHGIGQYGQAVVYLMRSSDLYQKTLGPDHPETLTTLNNLALAYRAAGKTAAAIALYEQVRDAQVAKFGLDHPQTLITLNNLAVAYRRAGKTTAAIGVLEQVRDARLAKFPPDHPETLTALNNLAAAHWDAGRPAAAVALFEQVRDAQLAKLGPHHPDTLTTLNNLAGAYSHVGRMDDAIPLLEQVRDARVTKLGPAHPSTLATLTNLAGAYREAGQAAEAIALLEQVRDAHMTKLGPDHPHTLSALVHLGQAYLDAGRTAAAVALLEQVRDASVAKLGPDHSDTLITLHALAWAYWEAGRTAAAIALYEQVRDARVTKLGPDHPHTLTTLNNLAVAYREAGSTAKAVALFEQIRDVQARKLGTDHPHTLNTLNGLARAFLQQQKYADAERILRHCLAIGEQKRPDAWMTFDTKSLLGGALLGQQKHAEAEPLLVQGYQGMKQRETRIRAQNKRFLPEALKRLVQVYEVLDKPAEAAKWRKELETHKKKEPGVRKQQSDPKPMPG